MQQPVIMHISNCAAYLQQENILSVLRHSDAGAQKAVFECLYTTHHASFIKRLPVVITVLPAETLRLIAEEMFNDALLQLHHNIRNGLFNEAMGHYSGYLYGIYKNLFLNAYRKELTKKIYHSNYDKIKQSCSLYAAAIGFKNDPEDIYTLLRIAIAKQKISCQEILQQDIFSALPDDTAAAALDYKAADVYRSARSRCRKDLLDTLKKEFGFNFN